MKHVAVKIAVWRAWLRWSSFSILISLLLVMVGIVFLSWMLRDQALTLPWVSHVIQLRIAQATEADVTVGDTVLRWDGDRRRLEIATQEILIKSPQQAFAARVPKMVLDYRLVDLLKLHLIPSTIHVIRPMLALNAIPIPEEKVMPADKTIMEWPQQLGVFFALPDHWLTSQHGLQRITLEGATLSMQRNESPWTWDIPSAVFTLEKQGSVFTRISAVPLKKAQPQYALVGDITMQQKNQTVGLGWHSIAYSDGKRDHTITMPQLRAETLLALVRPSLPQLPSTLVITGDVKTNIGVTFAADATVTGKGEIVAEGATLHYPTWFPEELHAQKMVLKAHYNHHRSTIALDHAELRLSDGPVITAQGEIAPAKDWSQFLGQIKFTIAETNMQHLHRFWPIPVAAEARQWVLDSIVAGQAKASGSIQMTEAMWERDEVTPQDVDVTIDLTAGQLRYFQGLPEAVGIDARAYFSGEAITIDIADAKILETGIAETKVMVPYFSNPSPEIAITGTAKGPVQDLLAYVPHNTKMTGLDKNFRTGLRGDAVTKVALYIPFGNDQDSNQIRYDLRSNMTGLSIPTHPKLSRFEDGKGTLAFDGSKVVLELDGKMLRHPAGLHYHLPLDPRQPSHLNFSGTLDAKTPLLTPYLSEGYAAVNLDITTLKEHTTIEGKVDLTKAALTLPQIGLMKPLAQRANLIFKAKRLPDTLQLEQFNLTNTEGLHIEGKADIDLKVEDWSMIQLLRAAYGTNDYSLHATQTKREYMLDLQGKSLDLAHFDWSSLSKGQGKRGIKVHMRAATSLMKNGVMLSNLRGNIECSAKVCETADISASSAHGLHTLLLEKTPEVHRLTIRSDDAGALMRAFNASQSLYKGRLHIEASAPLTQIPAHYQGRIAIDKFELRQTPILTRILTLGSLSGIIDMLRQQQGIPFKKLRGDIDYQLSVLSLKEWRAKGDSLGFTIDGKVNFATSKLDIRGTLVPALLGFNTLLNKVPFLGDALLGGPGKGIIGTNFTITGPLGKPETYANPLSTLAPGFLRLLFQ
jgi:hypothetical protein